jgi:hypothetical protein
MLGVGLGISLRFHGLASGGTTPTETYHILLESGDALLLESGDHLLTEAA